MTQSSSALNILGQEGQSGGVVESSEEGPEVRERGVQNPRVIDLITTRIPEYDSQYPREVVLEMLAEFDWDSEGSGQSDSYSEYQRLKQLEEKFNVYLEYILGGHLAEQYPDYADFPKRIVLSSKFPLTSEGVRMTDSMGEFCTQQGMHFEVVVGKERS